MSKKPKKESKDFRITGAKALAFLPRVNALKSQHGLTSCSDVLEFLLNELDKQSGQSTNGVVFSDSRKVVFKGAKYDVTEKQVVDFAIDVITFDRLVHKGVLAEAKRIYSESQNKTTPKKRGGRAESLKKISDAVDKQMEINKQGNKTAQRFINGTWLQKETKCNFPAIQEYLLIHQATIDAHNAECGLTKEHNATVLREEKRAVKMAAKKAKQDND